jgi:hypothetical protein
MIDEDIVENLESGFRQEVQYALAILVQSGVIQLQMDRLKEQLMLGNSSEPVSAVAERVLEFRKNHQALESLEELGSRYSTAREVEN